jgi:hypothetical protein
MVTAQIRLQLLVTARTSTAHRERLAKQIALLHPKQTAKVEILEWDGKTPPHKDADDKMRRYAATEVSDAVCEMGDTAVMEWSHKWRIVGKWGVSTRLQKAGERWLPMYVCLEGNKLDRSVV